MFTDGNGCLRMRHADRIGTFTARVRGGCRRARRCACEYTFARDALRGNFTARVRAPQGCERAGLDWSVLSSASARQASKITFASAKGRPSISRECSGKTDQAQPIKTGEAVCGRFEFCKEQAKEHTVYVTERATQARCKYAHNAMSVVGRPTKHPAYTAEETVALNPLGKCVRKGWGV